MRYAMQGDIDSAVDRIVTATLRATIDMLDRNRSLSAVGGIARLDDELKERIRTIRAEIHGTDSYVDGIVTKCACRRCKKQRRAERVR